MCHPCLTCHSTATEDDAEAELRMHRLVSPATVKPTLATDPSANVQYPISFAIQLSFRSFLFVYNMPAHRARNPGCCPPSTLSPTILQLPRSRRSGSGTRP